MAKLHSRKKGKSGRKMPKARAPPKWFAEDPEKIKETIRAMAKEGMPQAKIGIFLRDKYGVPNARIAIGTSLGSFLKKENLAPEYPDDLLNLIKKAVKVRSHLKMCKKDIANKVKLSHIESKILRLVKYYTANGKLPEDWKYDHERAVLLVK